MAMSGKKLVRKPASVTTAPTTTQVQQRAIKQNPTVFIGAFNKSIADEMQHKLLNSGGSEKNMTPSEEQQRYIEALKNPTGTGHLILSARAGTGKSSTLRLGVQAINGKPEVSTIHSLGFRVWRKVNPGARLKVEEDKVWNLIRAYEEKNPTYSSMVKQVGRGFLRQLVSLAKLNGMGVLLPKNSRTLEDLIDTYDLSMAGDVVTKEVYEWALQLVIDLFDQSISMDREVIDYDDMLFAPLIHGVRDSDFPKYDVVMIDEAQDMSSVRLELTKRCVGDRFIATGDPFQSIYMFTGSSSDVMGTLQKEFNAEVLPLTVTYRCPKQVVALANQWVPDLKAFDNAKEGEVTRQPYDTFDKSTLTRHDAVLCRNNKPLVEMAFSMLKNGQGVRIEGRDIGKSVLDSLNKYPDVRNCATMIDRILDAADRKAMKHEAAGKMAQADMAREKGDMIAALLQGCIDRGTVKVDDARVVITGLFGDTLPGQQHQVPTLSSVHKAKGKEWQTVYLLGRNEYMPSKRAVISGNQEILQQENNLCYVAVTRSLDKFVDLDVERK